MQTVYIEQHNVDIDSKYSYTMDIEYINTKLVDTASIVNAVFPTVFFLYKTGCIRICTVLSMVHNCILVRLSSTSGSFPNVTATNIRLSWAIFFV